MMDRLCEQCRKPIGEDRPKARICPECKKENIRQSRRRLWEQRSAAGLCQRCGRPVEPGRRTECLACASRKTKPRPEPEPEPEPEPNRPRVKFPLEPFPGMTATQVIRLQRAAGYESYGKFMAAKRCEMQRREEEEAAKRAARKARRSKK